MKKGECSVNISALADSILEMVNIKSSHKFSPKCSIYKVPKLLREGNEDAYTPKVVSIGPYHHMDDKLRPMESLKDACLQQYNDKSLIESCLETIKDRESNIRECYAYPIGLEGEEFYKMVLRDSIFIIQFLQGCSRPNEDHYKIGMSSAFGRAQYEEIIRDLHLLENQLPFFIVDQICTKLSRGDLFGSIVLNFYQSKYGEGDHLLHMMHDNLTGRLPNSTGGGGGVFTVSPTATQLHAAGVRFECRPIDAEMSIDTHISFDKRTGILRLPKLIAPDYWDPSQSLLRNMIALEQCIYLFDAPTHITDYCYFLDCLINTPRDVQLLADAGIIENWLGSEIVCDMYNGISKNARIIPWRYTYATLSQQLNTHCNKEWNHHKATLKDKYFSHPWAVISVIYAIILLLLTIAQLITGILAVPGV